MKKPAWWPGLEEMVCGVLMIVLTVSVEIQLINRNTFGISIPWTEELARYCFIWLSFAGISLGIKRGKHLTVELLINNLPKKGARILGFIIDFFFFVFCVAGIWYGAGIVQKMMAFGQKSPSLGIEMGVIYLAVPVGFGMSIFRIIEANYKRVKSAKENQK